ncbi:tetraacyldisaccharide 4'-kinase [Alteromonas lipolytica]|uniref:Tetraacyldisaccharide 4'-kinase n=2 Tax=Alteromonas lipolytica TaxID=1856405 RepID=A0A1E8FGJ6_9ALTE|nr:tetraacyldisaccharide 4'-kinase [Alteromonas lipolytica]
MWYEGRWYQWLFWPLSLLFYLISAIRRRLFVMGLKTSHKLPVPIIIVGNLSVGGNGKTPLVVALCEFLTEKGFKVGVVSRGYGAQTRDFPHQVSLTDKAATVGDEPLLIARRTGVPVVIDPIRPRGAERLVQLHCDVIISDDGLQHYALQRDIECVVADRRLFGNGHLLPMGPLREGLWRLNTIDFLVLNQSEQSASIALPADAPAPVTMRLKPGKLVNVLNPEVTRELCDANSEPAITAMAGIGDPSRFFSQLKALGVRLDHTIALADHQAIESGDIPQGCVIMTEKDAVKAAEYAHNNCWYQPVDAELTDEFYTQLTERLSRVIKNK